MPSARSHLRKGTQSRKSRKAVAPAGAVLEPASEKLKEATQKVKQEGERLITRQKRRAAHELRTVGTSIRHAASQLRKGPLEGVVRYVDAAAEGVARASRHLEEQDV